MNYFVEFNLWPPRLSVQKVSDLIGEQILVNKKQYDELRVLSKRLTPEMNQLQSELETLREQISHVGDESTTSNTSPDADDKRTSHGLVAIGHESADDDTDRRVQDVDTQR